MKKYLVAAKNTDGRICCWAQGTDLEAVKKNVDTRWPTHGGSGQGCYPGEQRGDTEIHVVHENGSVTPYVPERMPVPRGRPPENDKERADREEREEREFALRKDEGTLRRP